MGRWRVHTGFTVGRGSVGEEERGGERWQILAGFTVG